MKQENDNKSALSVSKGVEQPPCVNQDLLDAFRTRRSGKISRARLLDGIMKGNTSMLSQAITLVESSLPAHQDIAGGLVESCLPHSGKSLRIGITGVPGVGKSSFIEKFGLMLTAGGSKLAVLAIDPSSGRSKGSILGDKTRMEKLSADPSAFIRPSPSSGSLGGVAKMTKESIILCEAAGFDTIIVETVGVGQSETAVHSMVDFFLLLMLAGAGDELQGIKRGIIEMADMIAITKSDGDNVANSTRAKSQYQRALHLFPPPESGWAPRVTTCSALTGSGLDGIMDSMKEYFEFTGKTGFFQRNRDNQSVYWMDESVDRLLRGRFLKDPAVAAEAEKIRNEVAAGRISSFLGARKLLDIYLGKNRR
jgi:LAO/AO transport system kinase